MMSTQAGPGSYRNNISRPELLALVEERHMPCARSDAGVVGEADGPFAVDAQDRWIDCSIPC